MRGLWNFCFINMEILQSKIKEFDGLPANLLGVDGWVLRVVPKQQRNYFLQGYLKLLRVALHPDLCQFPSGRQSRENFIKAANEAVDYLCSGELAYDSAVDCVPSSKNPVVQLKHMLAAEAEAYEELKAKLAKLSESYKSSQASVHSLGKRLGVALNNLENTVYVTRSLKRELIALASRFPYPIGPDCVLKVRAINWKAFLAGEDFHKIINKCMDASVGGNKAVKPFEAYCSSPVDVTIQDGAAVNNPDKPRLYYAMTAASFGIAARVLMGFPKMVSEDVTDKLKNIMKNPSSGKFSETLEMCAMPMFSANSLLKIGDGFFVLESVIEYRSPAKQARWERSIVANRKKVENWKLESESRVLELKERKRKADEHKKRIKELKAQSKLADLDQKALDALVNYLDSPDRDKDRNDMLKAIRAI